MLFVFATMFYGKDELDEEIKNGRAQELFFTDKYIFLLAMLSMLFTIISNGIIHILESWSALAIIFRDF